MENSVVKFLEEKLIGHLDISERHKEFLFEQARHLERQNTIVAFLSGAEMGEMFNNENRTFLSDAIAYADKLNTK
jgi:hypothetical protein